MKRVTLFSVAVVTLVVFAGTAASANDIVDFLRAVQGSSRHDHHAHSGRIAVADARRGQVQGGYSSRDIYKHHQLRHESAVRHGLPGYGYDRYGYDRHAYSGSGRGIRIGGSSASLMIRTGGQTGPVYYGNPG